MAGADPGNKFGLFIYCPNSAWGYSLALAYEGEMDSVSVFEMLQELHLKKALPSGWLQLGASLQFSRASPSGDSYILIYIYIYAFRLRPCRGPPVSRHLSICSLLELQLLSWA